MINSEELRLVVAEAAALAPHMPKARWFAFGSSITDTPMPADIDIAVICQSHAETSLVREALETLSLLFPLHLMLLTEAEELELRFTEKQLCMKVYPV